MENFMKKNNLIKGMILCLLTVISWGVMFPIATVILKTMDPFYFTAIRYGVADIIFLIILYGLEGRKSFQLEGKGLKLFIFGTLGFAGYSFLTFGGQKIIGTSGAVQASIMMALMPLLTIIVNTFIKETKPQMFTLIIMCFALTGVLLVITKGDINNLLAVRTNLIGDTLIFIGTICWVFYTIGGTTTFNSWSPIRYTSLSCTMGVISIVALTLIGTQAKLIAPPLLNITLLNFWRLAYVAFIAGVMAVVCWNYGNKILTPINGSLFMNIVPVTTFVVSIMQGTHFKTVELIGALITICSLVANNVYIRSMKKTD